MSNRYSIYPASFVHAGGTLTLGQIGAARPSMNSNIDEVIVGGTVDRGANILQTAAPSATLSSHDLTNIFGTLSPSAGLSCTGNCIFQYQKRSDQAVYAGAGTNFLLTATKGFLMPTRLAARDSGPAALEMMFHALYDGTNPPYAASVSQNLTGTAAFNSRFYHGPVYVNGVQITGTIGVSIDFGIRFTPVYEDGVVFPTLGHIHARAPAINIQFAKLDVASTIGSMFIGALAGTIAVYFQKGVNSGSRVAAATTEHCKISAASGSWGIDDVSVQENDDATASVIVRPTAALAVSVASAIP